MAGHMLTEREYRRLQRLPEMLARARRKVEMLEREAERHGFRDLIPERRCPDDIDLPNRPVASRRMAL